MNPLRIFLLAALVLVVFGNSPGSANSTEFDFNFDDPETGEGNVDIGNNIELSIEIDNIISNSKEFRLEITNSVEYEEKGLRAWWSHDGQAALASESRILDGVDVSGESTRAGITVTVEAEDNAQYGTWDIDLKCKDNGDSNQDHIEYLTLKISVNQYVAFSIENYGVDSDSDGSIDVGGETIYEIHIINEGNRQDNFTITTSENEWDTELESTQLTIDAFSSEIVALTVTTDDNVDYGDEDTVHIIATSQSDSNEQYTLVLVTWVRVHYGLGLELLTNSNSLSGEPGDTVSFNFKILNKWFEIINYEIIKKDWYIGQIGNRPEGWTFVEGTGNLDAFQEKTDANVKITISSDADAGEVVTIILQAIASDDFGEGEPFELEIQISVEGEYNVVIVLPQSDTISLDANQTTSISQYVKVKNLASVSDVVTVSASWQLGGNDWNLSLPDPLVLSESEQKPLFIAVKAPQSAAGDQASLSIRVVSGGDSSKYDEVTLSFSVSEPYKSGPDLALTQFTSSDLVVYGGDAVRFTMIVLNEGESEATGNILLTQGSKLIQLGIIQFTVAEYGSSIVIYDYSVPVGYDGTLNLRATIDRASVLLLGPSDIIDDDYRNLTLSVRSMVDKPDSTNTTEDTTSKEEDYEGDEAGECSDEADNDKDGLFDCDDDTCAGSPACKATDIVEAVPEEGLSSLSFLPALISIGLLAIFRRK